MKISELIKLAEKFNKLAKSFDDKIQYLASLKNEAVRFLADIKDDTYVLDKLTLDFDNPYKTAKTLYSALYDHWKVMPAGKSKMDFYNKFVMPANNVLQTISQKLETVPPSPPADEKNEYVMKPVDIVGKVPPKYPPIDKKQQQALFTVLVWEGLIAPSFSRKVDGLLGPETRKLLDLFKQKVVNNTSISDKDALNIAQTVVEGKLPE